MLKRNIFLMYAISFFQGMVFYGSVATLYRQACGLTLFQITAIESIFSVVCIALEFPWGVIADRIGYRRTMLFCNLLFFISKIVFWKADTFGAFLCERLILSVVISGLSGVDDTVLFLSCGKQDAQRVFSIHGYFGTLGMVIASGCFSLFFSENFRAAAFWTVVAYALAALLSFGLKEVGAPKAQSLRKQLSSFRPAFFVSKSVYYISSCNGGYSRSVSADARISKSAALFAGRMEYGIHGSSAHRLAASFDECTFFRFYHKALECPPLFTFSSCAFCPLFFFTGLSRAVCCFVCGNRSNSNLLLFAGPASNKCPKSKHYGRKPRNSIKRSVPVYACDCNRYQFDCRPYLRNQFEQRFTGMQRTVFHFTGLCCVLAAIANVPPKEIKSIYRRTKSVTIPFK